MKLIKGNNLTPKLKADVLRAYVHRNTVEHPRANGGLQTTDAEWLASHAFYVTKNGNLSAKHRHCEPSYMANN